MKNKAGKVTGAVLIVFGTSLAQLGHQLFIGSDKVYGILLILVGLGFVVAGITVALYQIESSK